MQYVIYGMYYRSKCTFQPITLSYLPSRFLHFIAIISLYLINCLRVCKLVFFDEQLILHQDVMIVISLLRLFTFTSLSCVCILSLRSFSCTPLNRILTIHCICLYWRGGSVQNTELAPDNSHLYNHTTGQPEAKWL